MNLKSLLFIFSTFIFITLMFFPIPNVPKLGKLLNYSTGILQIKSPEISEANFTYLKNSSYKGNVNIDSLGIPHIFAESDNSAFYLLGRLHARDRYFQMELMIKMMQGRLSELVGKRALILDEYWRNFQFDNQSEHYFASEVSKNKDIYSRIVSYAEGVNDYLKTMNVGDIPEEYFLLDVKPMEWQPYYSLLMIKYMANTLNHGKNDLFFEEVRKNLNKEMVDLLYPMEDSYLEAIVPEKSVLTNPAVDKSIKSNNKLSNKVSSKISNEDRLWLEAQEIIGSNNWVVSAKKTASAEAILANDMHLQLTLPCPWYEVEISTPNRHIYGLSLPASPAIIAGFNEAISWGMTNAHWDLIDYYQPVYSDDLKQLKYGNKLLPIETINDTIFTKEGELKIIQAKLTEKGPIVKINDLEYLIEWTGFAPSNELITFSGFETASNFSSFETSLKHFSTPPQNFVYADTAGNIGIHTSGKMPIKRKGYERGVYLTSDTNAINYGYLSFERLPNIYNPDKNFIASANQRQYYGSIDYFNWAEMSAPFRGKRISDLLRETKMISIDDIQSIQADIVDLSVSELLPLLFPLIQNDSINTSYYEVLSNWNFEMNQDLIGPTIYSEFRRNLTLRMNDYILDKKDLMPLQDWNLISALKTTSSFNFDGKTLLRDSVILQSFRDGIDSLKNLYGNDLSQWHYGKYHTTTINHILKLPAFNFAEFSSNGSKFTVNVSNNKRATHGSSQRSIIKMSTPIEAYMMVAGGQSGRPTSPHFMDQLETWKKVGYHKVQFSRNKSELKNVLKVIEIGE